MLGAIRSVTVSAPDLAVIERAYGEFLDYRATRRGKVSPGEAEAWQAGQLAGARSTTTRGMGREGASLA